MLYLFFTLFVTFALCFGAGGFGGNSGHGNNNGGHGGNGGNGGHSNNNGGHNNNGGNNNNNGGNNGGNGGPTGGHGGNEYCRLGREMSRRLERAEYQREAVDRIHQSVVWPGSGEIIVEFESGNFSALEDIMEPDVFGRIAPVGIFDSILGTAEYYYGLAGPAPGQPTTGRIRMTSVSYPSPIVCWENKCSLTVEYHALDFDTNSVIFNFTQESHFNFNADDKICSYQIAFIRLSAFEFSRVLPAQLDPGTRAYYDSLPPAGQAAFIQQAISDVVCQIEGAVCQGAADQYPTYNDCMGFMLSREFGTWEQSDVDTVMCRYLHAQLAVVSPVRHCPHVGPTGGGKCIPRTDSSYYGLNLDSCRDLNY